MIFSYSKTTPTKLSNLSPGEAFIPENEVEYQDPTVWVVSRVWEDRRRTCMNLSDGTLVDLHEDAMVVVVQPKGLLTFVVR